MRPLLLSLLREVAEGLDELILDPVDGIPLLEERVELVLLGLCRGLLLDVDGVLQNFGIVHGAPADETAVVGEGGELVLFNVAMNSLLDVEVFAHLFAT